MQISSVAWDSNYQKVSVYWYNYELHKLEIHTTVNSQKRIQKLSGVVSRDGHKPLVQWFVPVGSSGQAGVRLFSAPPPSVHTVVEKRKWGRER